MPDASSRDLAPRVRFVLLGASNLTVALPWVVDRIISWFPNERVDVFAAHGPGRSYGLEAGMCGLKFSGIARCGLLRTLAQAVEEAPSDVYSIVTDIGNDIMYGADVGLIQSWLLEILEALSKYPGTITITRFPLQDVAAMAPSHYRIVRNIFFPARRLEQDEAVARMAALQDGFERLHAPPDVCVMDQEIEVRSPDRLHVNPFKARQVATSLVDPTVRRRFVERQALRARANGLPRLKVYRRPASCKLFGYPLRRTEKFTWISPKIKLYCF